MEPDLCKDCCHFEPQASLYHLVDGSIDPQASMCRHPKNNPPYGQTAYIARKGGAGLSAFCGKEGRYWKQKNI